MPSNSERAIAVRRKQLPDYTVRARTGTGSRDWMRVGSAWERTNAEGRKVVTVVLSAIPLSVNNRVTLKLLEPFEEDEAEETDEVPSEVEVEVEVPRSRRRRGGDPPPDDIPLS